MAVAKEQIGEIEEILMTYLDWDDFDKFFQELKQTVAYRENQSFRETIDMLANYEDK